MPEFLEPADNHYFQDCKADLSQLMYPIVIKRCVVTKREPSSSAYPDEPIEPDRQDIHTRADFAGVSAQEIERSGGTILSGDLKLWTFVELRGPESDTGDMPKGVADIVVLQGHEYVVVGFPDHAELTEGVSQGYASVVRRRATSHGVTGIYRPKK